MSEQDLRTNGEQRSVAESSPKTPAYCNGCGLHDYLRYYKLDPVGNTYPHPCIHAKACERMHNRMLGIVDGEME